MDAAHVQHGEATPWPHTFNTPGENKPIYQPEPFVEEDEEDEQNIVKRYLAASNYGPTEGLDFNILRHRHKQQRLAAHTVLQSRSIRRNCSCPVPKQYRLPPTSTPTSQMFPAVGFKSSSPREANESREKVKAGKPSSPISGTRSQTSRTSSRASSASEQRRASEKRAGKGSNSSKSAP